MEKRPDLEHLLSEVYEILRLIEKPQNSQEMNDPVLLAELNRIETSVQIFDQYQKEMFQEANVDPQRLTQESIASPHISAREKQFLKNAKELEEEVSAFHSALSKSLEQPKGRKKSSQSTNKQQIRERRKLFKSIGGDKNWIPL